MENGIEHYADCGFQEAAETGRTEQGETTQRTVAYFTF
jgi:hypothetical protein